MFYRSEADISNVDNERQEERNLLYKGATSDYPYSDRSIQDVEKQGLLDVRKTPAQCPISAQESTAAQNPIAAQESTAAQASTNAGVIRYKFYWDMLIMQHHSHVNG